MTPDEAASKMREINDAFERTGDAEYPHMQADELMCEVLCDLGYDEMVDIFEAMLRWYS